MSVESSPSRRVGIVAKLSSPEALAAAVELAEWLERRGCEVVVDPQTAELAPPLAGLARPLPGAGLDFAVALGGDGTLLSVARTMGGDAPILGGNLGRLGFLTEIDRAELYPGLVEILAGRYHLDERSLADVELSRADGSRHDYRALNDAVIAKSAVARIIELELRIDGRFVSTYRADGLIVSTPTGSTAYNLSAGGPILEPGLPVTVIAPICPHTLSQRPIVVPDSSIIELTLETQREQVYLTIDGQEGTDLHYRDRIAYRRAEHATARLVRISDRGFFDALRAKLHWGE